MFIRAALGTVVAGVLGCAEIAGVDAWTASDAGAGDYAAVVLADQPLAYWRFDEPAGTANAADASNNGIEGLYVAGVTLETPGVIEGTAR
jgi:hypothetical protein